MARTQPDALRSWLSLNVSIAVIGGVFSILTAAAPDIHTLTWARLLTGLGFGAAFPNLLALVNESSSAQQRNANVAFVYAGMPLVAQ